MKKFTIYNLQFTILIIILALTFYIPPTYAQAPDIGRSRIHPASYLYFLKATKETWQLKFAKTYQAKILLQLKFATTRLREAKTLLSENQDLIQPTLERYMASLKNFPDKPQEGDPMGLKIKEVLDFHLKVLEQMYPETSNPKAKMALRSVMNRVIQRADMSPSAKLPICTLFAKEASTSALNEVERAVLTARASRCFDRSNQAFEETNLR